MNTKMKDSINRKCLKWIALNVGFPALSAATALIIAHTALEQEKLNMLIKKAFAGGDNFVVASLILIVLLYEIEEAKNIFDFHLKLESIQYISTALILVFFCYYSVYKYKIFHEPNNNEFNYQGGSASFFAFIFSCLFAIFIKIYFTYHHTKESKDN